MKDLTQVFGWTMTSFFVGSGVYIGYIIIQAIFDKFEGLENIFLRLIFLTIIGGITIYIYKSFNNNQKD